MENTRDQHGSTLTWQDAEYVERSLNTLRASVSNLQTILAPLLREARLRPDIESGNLDRCSGIITEFDNDTGNGMIRCIDDNNVYQFAYYDILDKEIPVDMLQLPVTFERTITYHSNVAKEIKINGQD